MQKRARGVLGVPAVPLVYNEFAAGYRNGPKCWEARPWLFIGRAAGHKKKTSGAFLWPGPVNAATQQRIRYSTSRAQ
jgi:hypothetical protein